MTAPAVSPATWVAAKWLAGLTADSLAGVDDQASFAGVRALDGGSALELDGQKVCTAELAGGALLLGRLLVKELARRSGRTPLAVALDLAGLVDRPCPGRAGP